MVAIKPAHEKLRPNDIWPDMPWTWTDVSRIKEECRQRALLKESELDKVFFAAAREWELYLQSFPSLKERQQILNNIYPTAVYFSMSFTEEERDYLVEKLFGINDEIGQNILKKLFVDRGMKSNYKSNYETY